MSAPVAYGRGAAARRSPTDLLEVPPVSAPLRAAAVVLLLALVGCSDDKAARDDSGAVATEGSVAADEISVGDCVNDPEGVESEEGAEFTSIDAVPCDQPHDNEVYHQYELPEGDWPGDDAVFQSAGEGCQGEFEAFVGTPYDQSALDFAPIVPNQVAWDEGDREVSCAVYDPEGGKVTGTLKGAAR